MKRAARKFLGDSPEPAFFETVADFIAKISARMLACRRLSNMKKLVFMISVVLLSVAICTTARAQISSRKNSVAAARADRKMQKKQAKAMKKYMKAQKKADKKMIKKDRKNTHLPGQSRK
jgi:hypothetical protein